MTVELPDPQYDFDVALSFAGEDRDYVDDVASNLKAAQLRVFYDADYLAETWGEDLVEFFDGVYRVRAQFAILFVSRAYAEKTWTRHERRSALARALEQRTAYVLPVRLDDTELPGLRSTVGYLDARRVGIEGLVKTFLAKHKGTTAVAVVAPIIGVPRTEDELARLLLERPSGWEYLYFAGALLQERARHEPAYRDHEMRYAPPSGTRLSRLEVTDYIDASTDQAIHLAASLHDVMDEKPQERAFGRPGESGDPDMILHLARRWTSVYEGFLDWAARHRATSAAPDIREVLRALAHYADGPIEQYRAFVDELVVEFDQLPSRLASGGPVHIDLTFAPSIAPESVERLREVRARTGI